MSRLCDLSIDEVTDGIRNQHFSAEEYVSQILERISKLDGRYQGLCECQY